MDVKAAIECLSKIILKYEEKLKRYTYNGKIEALGYKKLKNKIDALYIARSSLRHNTWIPTEEKGPYLLEFGSNNLIGVAATSQPVLCCESNGNCCIGFCFELNKKIKWVRLSDGKIFKCVAWMELPDTSEIVEEVKHHYQN